MLLQGPCESASPGWLPTLLALGRGGCTVPVPHPSTSQPRDAKRLALLGAGLLRADLAAGHMSTCLIFFTCTITVVWCSFPAGKVSTVIPLHLLHGFLLPGDRWKQPRGSPLVGPTQEVECILKSLPV